MTILSNGRVRRTAREWRKIFRQFDRSNLTATAFCERNAITLSSFRRWQKKLGSDGPAIEAHDRESEKFVEVATSDAFAAFWAVEIEMPDGRVLRMRG